MKDVYEMAALYAIAIATGHCFNNGNKRTAMVSMIIFLYLNGIEFNVDNTEMEDMMVEVGDSRIDHNGLTNWLKLNAKN